MFCSTAFLWCSLTVRALAMFTLSSPLPMPIPKSAAAQRTSRDVLRGLSSAKFINPILIDFKMSAGKYRLKS